MTRPPRAKGQSLAEYGLALALVSVVCITGLQALGGTLSGQFTNISGRIGNVSTQRGGSTSSSGFISPSSNFGGAAASSAAQMGPSVGGLPLTTVTQTNPDGTTSVTQVAGSNATVTGGCVGDSCATGIHPITANGIDTSVTMPPTTFSTTTTAITP